MATPQHSIVFWAPPVNADPAIEVGDVLIPDDDGSGDWVIATSANRGTRGSEGVALQVMGGTGFGPVEIQQAGTLDATITSLPPGAKQLVRVSSAGRIERIASYTSGDDVIGYAEADGRVHLHFGIPWGEIITLAGGISPAGDPGDTQYNLDDAQLTASQQGIAPEFFGVLSTGTAAANNAQLLTVGAAFGGARGDFALTVPTKTFSTEGFSRSLTPGTERWPYGLSVMGKGPTSVFQLAPDSVPDSNHLFLFEDTSSDRLRETTLQNFQVKGTASGHYGAGGGTDQNAIEIGYLGSDGGSRFLIFGVTGYRLKGRCVSITSADGLSFGPRVFGVLAEDCHYGFVYAHPTSAMGNQAIFCNTGIRVNGNVSDIGSTYQSCNTAHTAIGGGNDAHDLSLGCRYVHNTIVFTVGTLTNGKLISDCLVYEGAVNFAAGGAVVSVNGGQWDATTYELLGASVWRGIDFDDGYSGVITIGASSQNEFMRDCRDMTGNVPAMIGEYIQAEFAFAANTDEVISRQKSVAATLIITDGAAAVARKATSTLLARVGNERRIINASTLYAHQFAYASGAAVTIPAGTSMLVGTDASGDAIELDPKPAGSSGAPTNATYVTLSTNGTLTDERVLTAGTGISLTDGGAGGNITVTNTLPYNGITGSDQHVMFFDGANTPAGDGGLTYNKTTDVLSVASGIGIGGGTIYSATAKLRFAYAATDTIIGVKDSGGTDRKLLERTSADSYTMGAGGTTFVGWQDWYQLNLWGRGGGLFVYSGSGGSNTLKADGSEIGVALPRHGWGKPFASEGKADLTTGTHTLVAAEYQMAIWVCNGSEGAVYTIPAATADTSYTKDIVQLGTSVTFTDGTRSVVVPASGTSGGGRLIVTDDQLNYVYGTAVVGT